ncbi:MAG: serine/threonine-protein kinase [Myxococcota bacterium]
MPTGRSGGGRSIGPTVKDYRLTGRLGAGAMGEVYEGVHALIGKRVAVKVLKVGVQDALNSAQRLLEEARAVNVVGHPGIVDIFDAGTLEDGRPYLVMERLEGRSLHEELKRRGALPLREVFHLLAGILEPLAAAHAAGVIHRDLKPSNVFLCNAPVGLPRVKLVDFGVARRASRAEIFTQPLTTVGSLGYMGPEHLAGEVEPASDLYSVGCLAYQLVTGGPVFDVRNPAQLAQKHLDERPASPRVRRPDTPLELEAWILWLLEKAPADRPSSAEVALAVLREAEAASEGQGTTPGGPQFGELARAFDRQARSKASAHKVDPSAPTSGRPVSRPAVKPVSAAEAHAGRAPSSHPPGAAKPAPAKPARGAVETRTDRPPRSSGGTDLMPAFEPPTHRSEAQTHFDEDDDVPANERSTVLNYRRPDKS